MAREPRLLDPSRACVGAREAFPARKLFGPRIRPFISRPLDITRAVLSPAAIRGPGRADPRAGKR